MIAGKLSLRPAVVGDLEEIGQIFVDTITSVCRKDYGEEQIRVWTSSIEDNRRWINKIKDQYFVVAVMEDRIVGFASLANTNYLDLLYVHNGFQRQGVAAMLYFEMEKKAMENGADTIYSDVSITAQPFFEKMGFATLALQVNKLRGVDISNLRMVKALLR